METDSKTNILINSQDNTQQKYLLHLSLIHTLNSRKDEKKKLYNEYISSCISSLRQYQSEFLDSMPLELRSMTITDYFENYKGNLNLAINSFKPDLSSIFDQAAFSNTINNNNNNNNNNETNSSIDIPINEALMNKNPKKESFYFGNLQNKIKGKNQGGEGGGTVKNKEENKGFMSKKKLNESNRKRKREDNDDSEDNAKEKENKPYYETTTVNPPKALGTPNSKLPLLSKEKTFNFYEKSSKKLNFQIKESKDKFEKLANGEFENAGPFINKLLSPIKKPWMP